MTWQYPILRVTCSGREPLHLPFPLGCPMQAKLTVYKGKAKQQELLLELPAMVGRSGAVGVTVKHPVVSRQHCEIFEADGLVKVRDLGSTNGTSVRGKKVSEAILRPGDRFTIGSFTFEVDYECPAEANGGEDDEGRTQVVSPAPAKARRRAPEQPPQDEEPADAFAPAMGERVPQARPKQHAAASAMDVGHDLGPDPTFEDLLNDFFGGFQGRDMEDFLKGLE